MAMDIVRRKDLLSEYDEATFQSSSCPQPSSRWICESPTRPSTNTQRSTKPFIIGITGGSASGKTSCCTTVVENLRNERVAVISLDSYYKTLNSEEIRQVKEQSYNFDHPDAFDWKLLEAHLTNLSRGRSVRVPEYDFTSHSRTENLSQTIHGSITDVIVLEGILIFHKDEIVKLMDMKVFVDTDADVRLARRVTRDMAERGRDLNGILFQYEKSVKPAFDQFILPTKKKADVVIPRGASNVVAIDVLVQHISLQLSGRSRLQQVRHVPFI
eukprot:TRINITY_DN824_c0_g2_i12.p1 TRINITY_DN824_c0_g2~~TRINITY_DN824_c0_g2_i12.p1  ORF type:complete len:271 (-),score=33.73 TRINITY_DN824_c0_g2_i12:221-1033(-)